MITFLSYSLSDKMMVWLLLDSLFIGTYLYSSQKGLVTELIEALWHRTATFAKGLLEKVPKYKAD